MKTKLIDVFDIPPAEYKKHKMRVSDIITGSAGDIDHEILLARNMANKILKIDKAYGRYLVAEELKAPHLGEIFLARFKELTYTVHDWRKEKIAAFLKDVEEEKKKLKESEEVTESE